jgi:hypothetical protein
MMEVSPQTCRLQPFTKEETEQYISRRLKIAGASGNLFTASALGQIYLISGGIPRVINSVCDHALLTGYSKNLGIINAAVIEECAQDFFLSKENLTSGRNPLRGFRNRITHSRNPLLKSGRRLLNPMGWARSFENGNMAMGS